MIKKIIKTLDSHVKNILDSVQYSTVQYSTVQYSTVQGKIYLERGCSYLAALLQWKGARHNNYTCSFLLDRGVYL